MDSSGFGQVLEGLFQAIAGAFTCLVVTVFLLLGTTVTFLLLWLCK